VVVVAAVDVSVVSAGDVWAFPVVRVADVAAVGGKAIIRK